MWASLASLIVAGLMASAVPVAAAEAAPACHVAPIAEWPAHSLRWDGGCKDGKANGSGVLRAYAKPPAATGIFYGQMQGGEMALGVMEIPDGYRAGRFIQGKLQADAERNTLIKAFEVASQAAKDFSARLLKAGNASSAKFYLAKSTELAQQMD